MRPLTRPRARLTAGAAILLAVGAVATAGQASESKTNTPMSGQTAKQGAMGSNYDAGKRKLRNLFVEWGCRGTDEGAPIYTSASKSGKVYATVSRSTGKFSATIVTNYGVGDSGVFDQSLGKATIKISGKLKSRPGKVSGTGTVSVKTAQCSTGPLKYSWKGTNGT